MSETEIAKMVQTILIQHFPVASSDFHWNKSLETLNEAFGILGILLELEALLKNYFKRDISLLSNIDPTFNTPKDIVILIKEKYF